MNASGFVVGCLLTSEQANDEGSILIGAKMKPVPEFPNYLVTENGEVFSTMPCNTSPNGEPHPVRVFMWNRYRAVHLHNGTGKSIKKKVAYLVLTTFVGLRPRGHVIRHGANGIMDDCLQNLSWGTSEQNELDKIRDNTMFKGESHYSSKLNSLQVRIIRHAYWPKGTNGISAQDLAEIFGVNDTMIHKIVDRKSWKHI